jgi:hypothetical protein
VRSLGRRRNGGRIPASESNRSLAGIIPSGYLEWRLAPRRAARLDGLEERRAAMCEGLASLADEPDGVWEERHLEMEHAWDTLVQDFEEQLANLA